MMRCEPRQRATDTDVRCLGVVALAGHSSQAHAKEMDKERERKMEKLRARQAKRKRRKSRKAQTAGDAAPMPSGK